MASIIRIKRSSVSGNPATLGAGELAYSALTDNGSNGGDRLYIGIGSETSGNAANHFVIGGKYFTDMMDHTKGTLTASSAILVDSDSKIDNLKVDNLDLNGNTISSTNSDGNIVLDPNGTGYVSITGTNGIVIPVGDNAQRGPAVRGAIRYNTDSSSFEGYSGSTWGSLGGVKSVDGLTYITAESTPGASNDTLSFVTDNVERFFIDTNSAEFDSSVDVKIDATTSSSSTSTGALVVTGGVGIGGALYVSGAISAASASFASINNTPIGNSTPSTGAFTTLTANNAVTLTANTSSSSTTTGTLVVTGGVGISQNAFIGGTLSAAGAVTLSSTLGVTGNTTLTGDLTVNGNTTIGNDNSDTVTVNADVASSLIPSSDGSYDLGASGSEWRNLYVTGTANIDSLVADTADINGGSIDGVTIGTNSVVTELRVDNITVDGNEISSTNSNGNISLNPNGTGTVDVNSSRITSLSDPTGAQDAATKAYVDSVAEGLSVKPAVRAATTADLGATYDNGTSGVGATLTIPATATLDIDGVDSWSVYDGILVKDQTNAEENGRYYVSTIGNISTAWILTRCAKCDQPAEIPSMYVFVQEGDTYNSTGWVATVDTLPLVVGTGDIVFTQFSGAGTYLAGDGLGITGSTFNVLVAANGGIEISADALQLKSGVAGAGLTYSSGVIDVVGTADRITANSNSIDIASTYVGQSSITTLGTIATGTWQGSVVGPTYGGTGVNNGSKTITLGGNFTHSGAHTLTLTTTANTSVTLPTTGTLATLAGTESLSNKTFTNTTTFSASTASTNTTSGAVVVTGGVGIGGAVFMGSNLTGAGASTSTIDGFQIDGGTY